MLPVSCRWVAFDAVGTLIRAEPSVAEVYHRMGQQHGSQLSLVEVDLRFRESFRLRMQSERDRTTEADESAFWRQVVADVLADVSDQKACFVELHEWFARPSAWRCFDDVTPMLAALGKRGVQIAIASNYDSRLHPVCDGLPELSDITTRIVSSEVGWRKPHASFYESLIDACGGDPSAIVMVGDDWENDVLGAKQAGLRAILVDRSLSDISHTTDDCVISSLMDLVT
ncbi:MAG: HAD-IA family hydrolase [Planctomycetaceae bacterium]|nr:HAD-IA family hydrolase [Planctomycetaceae bacterium]